MMIVHEVMGRDCGWLTAATAKAYRDTLSKRPLLPTIGARASPSGPRLALASALALTSALALASALTLAVRSRAAQA